MKKITLFAVVCIAAASFASCKKVYTCTCTYSDGSKETYSTGTKVKKKTAEAWCSSSSSYATCTLNK